MSLKPRHATPTVFARLVTVKRKLKWLIDRCPYCGRPHLHTAGDGTTDPRGHLGRRESHCQEWRAGYDYVLTEDWRTPVEPPARPARKPVGPSITRRDAVRIEKLLREAERAAAEVVGIVDARQVTASLAGRALGLRRAVALLRMGLEGVA